MNTLPRIKEGGLILGNIHNKQFSEFYSYSVLFEETVWNFFSFNVHNHQVTQTVCSVSQKCTVHRARVQGCNACVGSELH